MAHASVNQAQVRRAIVAYRRAMRQDLTGAIQASEEDLANRLEGWLPIQSDCRLMPSGCHSPESERVGRLKEAARKRPFWLRGQRLLERGHGCGIDEVIGHLTREEPWVSPDTAVDRLVTHVAHIRALRGRGGRYGMISRGLTHEVAQVIAQRQLDYDLLQGELDDLAEQLTKELALVLSPGEETSHTSWLRSFYHLYVAGNANDCEFADLLARQDQELIEVLRPRKLSWRAVVAAKLGVVPNRPDDHKLAKLPRLRKSLRRAA